MPTKAGELWDLSLSEISGMNSGVEVNRKEGMSQACSLNIAMVPAPMAGETRVEVKITIQVYPTTPND